nr:hypothetical protein [Candidatus Frankia alpina]
MAAQPAVHPPQPPGGRRGGVPFDARQVAAVDAGQTQCRRVEHPQCPAPVLHPHRPVGQQRVEGMPVEVTGHRRVVANRAHPPRRLRDRCRAQPGDVDDLRRPHPHRRRRRRQRQQVDMMVVQSGQQRAAVDVDDGLTRARAQRVGADLDDPPAREPHVREPHVAQAWQFCQLRPADE